VHVCKTKLLRSRRIACAERTQLTRGDLVSFYCIGFGEKSTHVFDERLGDRGWTEEPFRRYAGLVRSAPGTRAELSVYNIDSKV
jgi:hypothetical protein